MNKIFLGCILVGVLAIAGLVVGAWLFFGKLLPWSKVGQKQPLKAHRVQGESQGSVPYAPIDENKVVSMIVDSKGGVLKTDLAGGVKVFLVIPKDSVIEDAEATILPYQKMPSGKNHPALSDELGFGAQVVIKSIQTGIRAYLIFDTTGGKAAQEAAKKAKFYNRCDPTQIWFNPIICARQNKVSVKKTIDKNYAVVTPIHTKEYNKLVFTRLTIPVGIEGLVVAEINRSDVYIPQKLDQDLVWGLINGTIGKYINHPEKLEAGALAMEWGLAEKLSQDQLEELAETFLGGETYPARGKSLFNAQNYLNLAKGKANWQNLLDDFAKDYKDTQENLFEDAQNDSKSFSVHSVEATAVMAGLSEINFQGALALKKEMQANFYQEVKAPQSSYDEVLSAAEAAQMTGQGEPEAMANLQSEFANRVNEILSDPNATIEDLLHGAELAQQTGLPNDEEITEQAVSRSCGILKNSIPEASRRELYQIAEQAQQLGCDDVASQALDLAPQTADRECNLIKKNLENYGMNRCN